MRFEDAYGRLPQGWLTEPEAKLLWEEAKRTQGAIVEVGCYAGRSTALLLSLGRPVHCVDLWDDGFTDVPGDEMFAMFLRNVAPFGSPIVHRVPVEEWAPVPAGFAYLDGDHSYQGTVDQVEKALACGPASIAIHDVNDDGGGLDVKRAAVEALGAWHERAERLAVWRLK